MAIMLSSEIKTTGSFSWAFVSSLVVIAAMLGHVSAQFFTFNMISDHMFYPI